LSFLKILNYHKKKLTTKNENILGFKWCKILSNFAFFFQGIDINSLNIEKRNEIHGVSLFLFQLKSELNLRIRVNLNFPIFIE